MTGFSARTRWYRSAYAVVGIATLLAVVVTWLVGRAVPGFTIWVFVVETEMIVGFAVFWAVQTVELGGRVRRVRSPTG